MLQHRGHQQAAFIVAQDELLGEIGQDADAVGAGVDHEIDAAALAVEVEATLLVENGGRDREYATVDGIDLGHGHGVSLLVMVGRLAAGNQYTAHHTALYIETFPSHDRFYDSPGGHPCGTRTHMKATLDVLMSRLRMKQLQLLIALDDHKSLHQAASAMAMTQSAASKALQELEGMLDAPLFERSKTGMRPNQFGHCVIRYARLLATDLTALCQDMAEIRSGKGGHLAVGAIMGAVPDVLVPALETMQADQPNLSIEIVEDTSLRMLTLLDDGRLDLVIGRALVSDQPARYHYQAIGDEPISAVVGFGHAAPRARELTFADLAGYRWIVYPGQMPMHELLQRELDMAGQGMPPNAITTASTFVTVAMLQRSAKLVSLLPTSVAVLFARHKMLRILPVRMQSRQQTFGVVTRRGGTLSAASTQLIRLLRAGRAQA